MRLLGRASAVGSVFLAGCSLVESPEDLEEDAGAVSEPNEETSERSTETPPAGMPHPDAPTTTPPIPDPSTLETEDTPDSSSSQSTESSARTAADPTTAAPEGTAAAADEVATTESAMRSAPEAGSAASSAASSSTSGSAGGSSSSSTPTSESSEATPTSPRRVDGPHTVVRDGEDELSQFAEVGSATVSTSTEGYLCEIDVSANYRTQFDYASQSGRPVDLFLYDAAEFEAEPSEADPFASVSAADAFSVGPFTLTPGRTAVVVVPTNADEAIVDYELSVQRSE